MACAAISIFVGHTVSQVTATQDTLKTYVMPRVVTDTQAAEIAKFLSSHESATVVNVLANAGDPEAIEYAGQLTAVAGRPIWGQ
jgi:hypothetical protein